MDIAQPAGRCGSSVRCARASLWPAPPGRSEASGSSLCRPGPVSRPEAGSCPTGRPSRTPRLRITLDHLGRPAEETKEKNARRQAARPGRRGLPHPREVPRPARAGGARRSFEVRTGPLTSQSVSGVQCTLSAPPLWPEIRPQ
ncbi:DUF6420 family protein [Streptomyces canus]|uniref:DUF6420 family protein n=1 Tax=Streptomyces canus TaxID=58343 RepID=UPI003721EBBC